jgi:hypothetical protein
MIVGEDANIQRQGQISAVGYIFFTLRSIENRLTSYFKRKKYDAATLRRLVFCPCRG